MQQVRALVDELAKEVEAGYKLQLRGRLRAPSLRGRRGRCNRLCMPVRVGPCRLGAPLVRARGFGLFGTGHLGRMHAELASPGFRAVIRTLRRRRGELEALRIAPRLSEHRTPNASKRSRGCGR